jgi:hypothetical protein
VESISEALLISSDRSADSLPSLSAGLNRAVEELSDPNAFKNLYQVCPNVHASVDNTRWLQQAVFCAIRVAVCRMLALL